MFLWETGGSCLGVGGEQRGTYMGSTTYYKDYAAINCINGLSYVAASLVAPFQLVCGKLIENMRFFVWGVSDAAGAIGCIKCHSAPRGDFFLAVLSYIRSMGRRTGKVKSEMLYSSNVCCLKKNRKACKSKEESKQPPCPSTAFQPFRHPLSIDSHCQRRSLQIPLPIPPPNLSTKISH